jgi:hypothetical protein
MPVSASIHFLVQTGPGRWRIPVSVAAAPFRPPRNIDERSRPVAYPARAGSRVHALGVRGDECSQGRRYLPWPQSSQRSVDAPHTSTGVG